MKLNDDLSRKLLEALNDFYYREYGSEDDELEIPDVIPIAYTEYEFKDDIHAISIEYDINKNTYINLVDEEVVLIQDCTIEQLITDLKYASFDDFIRDCLDEAVNKYGDTI